MKRSLPIQTPCPCGESWSDTAEEDGGRRCQRCDEHLVDISLLTRSQAKQLKKLSAKVGGLCASVRRDERGAPIYARTKTRRLVVTAGAVLSVSLAITIRELRADDDFVHLTELIHLAYAPLAAKGLSYWGSTQTVDDTRYRCARGETWVAEEDGAYVATVTLYAPGTGHGGGWYAQPDVAKFGQLCVHPRLQGTGLGARMLDWCEDRARALGATHLACDTSEEATALIALYTRRGYVFVQHMDFRPKVNYRSVLLSLDLGDSSARNDHA